MVNLVVRPLDQIPPRLYVDNGDGTYSEQITASAAINVTNLNVGPVTIADGDDASEGKTDDTAITNPALPGTIQAKLGGVLTRLASLLLDADALALVGGAPDDAAVIDPAATASIAARLAGLQALHYGAHHAASVMTIAAGIGDVGARATRTACYLYCPASNAAPVLISGVFPVPVGVPFPVASVDQIDFTGTNDDVLDVLEVYN